VHIIVLVNGWGGGGIRTVEFLDGSLTLGEVGPRNHLIPYATHVAVHNWLQVMRQLTLLIHIDFLYQDTKIKKIDKTTIFARNQLIGGENEREFDVGAC
jgi:hypothetical protein